MIDVNGISKLYGDKKALDNVSVKFEDGKIYGLLGGNGAGKTTLINIITNRIFPTAGAVLYNGENVKENSNVQEKIICMTEKSGYPNEMKAKKGLYWTNQLHDGFDVEYAKALSEKFGLDLNKKIGALSTGYQSIYKAILALASDAKIIILDEPVLGLDANHRKLFYEELIKNYSQKPRCIIISTHLIEEVANILEEVIIIDSGKIILAKPLEEILSLAYNVSGAVKNVDSYLEKIKSTKEIISMEKLGRFKTATIYGMRSKNDEKIIKDLDLETGMAKLQDLFISITKNASKKNIEGEIS